VIVETKQASRAGHVISVLPKSSTNRKAVLTLPSESLCDLTPQHLEPQEQSPTNGTMDDRLEYGFSLIRQAGDI